jgi:hypothetical protein
MCRHVGGCYRPVNSFKELSAPAIRGNNQRGPAAGAEEQGPELMSHAPTRGKYQRPVCRGTSLTA